MSRHRLIVLALLLGLGQMALCAGCDSSLPPTVEVRGHVTWRGKPLSDGKVTFYPAARDGARPRPGLCDLKPDGSFVMSTFRASDGVVPGEYHVLINSYTSQPTEDNPTAPWIWRIPDKYGDPKRTPLRVTIPADAGDIIERDFDVTD